MDAFLSLSQDQIRNPKSSSSSLNYPSSINNDQRYKFEYDNSLHYINNSYDNPSPDQPQLIDPPSYQDSSSSTFPAYFRANEQTPIFLEMITAANNFESSHISVDADSLPQQSHTQSISFSRERMNDETKIGFRMKTQLEVLDDGYTWRKYGKKKIKCTPNPRNYYKCSTVGCKIKKRVDRDRADSRYVIVTYIGKHNHEVPSLVPSNTYPTE